MSRTSLTITIVIAALIIRMAPGTVLASEGLWQKIPDTDSLYLNLEITPWGFVAGEFDTRLWLNPYNGIYLSEDLGETWDPKGLAERGVTDVSYSDYKIYASTYYDVLGIAGLFVSEDKGASWNHLGNDIPAESVDVQGDTIILGTITHGLWVSQDGGNTWKQKIGDGFFGNTFNDVEILENIAIATSELNTYISYDWGNSWSEITFLKNERIKSVKLTDSVILAGTNNNRGMYRSIDSGNTWSKVESWGTKNVGTINFHKGIFYAGGDYDIYRSFDMGETWEPTGLNSYYPSEEVRSSAIAYTSPSILLVNTPYEGLYKYEIPAQIINKNPFLRIPWNSTKAVDLIRKITSYFDHEYPLINYNLHQEPPVAQNSIINFSGEIKESYEASYSGHDGYDYALDFGTPILAGASGQAIYRWTNTKGHTIIIDHLNGYSTEYAHLQETNLVTKDRNISTWVSEGQQVGLVGMTGMTSGPHLHFTVYKGSDEVKKTDPYGWQSTEMFDPWTNFQWTDVEGFHTGTSSKYLWKDFPQKVQEYFDFSGGVIELDPLKIIVDQNSSEKNFTIFVEPYEEPYIPESQKDRIYIEDSSVLVLLSNLMDIEIDEMLKPIRIELDYSNYNRYDVLANTLKWYFWNEETKVWEEVNSYFDWVTRRVIGETYHFSHFAVFGEKNPAYFNWTDSLALGNSRFEINF